MKLYCLSLNGYETYIPIILFHEKEKLKFDKIAKEAFISVISKIASSDDRDMQHNLLEEFSLIELVADYLVENMGFIKPDLNEFDIREFSFFGPLYSERSSSSKFARKGLPKWIPQDLQQKMFEVTEKFIKEDKKKNEVV